MDNATAPSKKKSWKRGLKVVLTVVVLITLAAALQQGPIHDVLDDLRRYRSALEEPPTTANSETAEFDLGDIHFNLVSSELALPEFDPWSTPTVSGIDLDRLINAAENLDLERSCPLAEPLATGSDLVEILRFVDGCLLIAYEALDGRSVAELREQYGSDTSVLAIDRPALAFPLQSQQDPDASNQWHLDTVDAATLQAGWPEGAEVTVAVLDTGVDGTHPDLDGNLLDGYGLNKGKTDEHGHGTHVAGIIAAEADNGEYGKGVAPLASILPINNLVRWTVEVEEQVVSPTQGVIWSIDNEVDIINMSFGLWGDTPGIFGEDPENLSNPGYLEDPNQTFEAIIRTAQLRGILAVAAAGNCGDGDDRCLYKDQIIYPAGFPGVISVGATSESGERANFSSVGTDKDIARNRWVDIAAPGENIYSTTSHNDDEDLFVNKSGTSMAAPVVSAVLAHLIARYPTLGPDLLVQAMFQTAENPNGEAWTKEFGHGLVRPLKAIRWIENNVPITDVIEIVEEQEIDYNEIERSSGDIAVILVVDTSRSMADIVDGQVKLEVAKASILTFLATTSLTRPVALRTYPAINDGSCNSGELRIAPSPKTYEMENEVRLLRADGDTPTAEALRAALGDIQDAGFSQAEIVLVSDGESTCANPCTVASEAAASGVEVTVHTVGFRLSPEGDEELKCVAEATEGTYVEVQEGEELAEAIEANSKPDLKLELTLPDSVQPSTQLDREWQQVEVVIYNDSNVAAKNVIVSLEFGDGPDTDRQMEFLGNIAPGKSLNSSSSLVPGFNMVGSEVDVRVSATASNTDEAASSTGVVLVRDPNVAKEAGPILGGGEILLMGDQLLSGVGSSNQVPGTCEGTGEVGLLGIFDQPSKRSVACANSVIPYLVTPDWGRNVDSQINQLLDLVDDAEILDAVVLSIGATDAGLSELVQACVLSSVSCDSEVFGVKTDVWLGESIAVDGLRRATVLSDLIRAIAAIDEGLNLGREQARHPPILLLAQPRAFSVVNGACFERWQGSDPPVLTQRELDLYHYFVSALNGTLEAAAKAAQQLGLPVFFVSTTETAYLPDHTACSDEPYVVSLEPLLESDPGVASDLAEGTILEVVGEDSVAAFNQRFLTPNRNGEQALANAVLNWSRSEEASEAQSTLGERFAHRVESVAARIGSLPTAPARSLSQDQEIISEPDQVWIAKASGFLPGTLVTATVQPQNRVVGSALADKTGAVELSVTLPSTSTSESITLVASGLGPTGRTISTAQPITVLQPLRPLAAITLPALAVVLYLGALLVWRALRRRPLPDDSRGVDSS